MGQFPLHIFTEPGVHLLGHPCIGITLPPTLYAIGWSVKCIKFGDRRPPPDPRSVLYIERVPTMVPSHQKSSLPIETPKEKMPGSWPRATRGYYYERETSKERSLFKLDCL